MMIEELERIWRETAVSQYIYCPEIFHEGLRTTTNTSIRIAGAPAEI
jgi:hypothetical protein